MEAVFPLLMMGLAVSIAYLVNSFRRQRQMQAWERAAERAGLADVLASEGGLFDGGSLEGYAGGLHVRLESYRRGKYEHGTRIVVSGMGHGTGGLSLRREGLATAFEKSFVGQREIEIGDASFDEQLFVRGQAPMTFAVLGPDVRAPLTRLLGGQLAIGGAEPVSVSASLADDHLEVRVRESGFSKANRERLPAILEHVLGVARTLVVGNDVPARIAANLEREPADGVRLRALATLAREFPGHPATRERLQAALRDRSDEVRLRAATALGDEGRDTLLEILTRAADDSCVARAVGALGEHLPAELAEATLRRSLAASVRPETVLACLEHLRAHGRPEAEALVVEALRSQDDAVVEAAARTLGRIGTVAAVTPLLGASGGGRSSACRQAIAEIQSRLPGAGAGQLSIAAGEAGALSLAEGDPGRLSLAESEPAASPPSADTAPIQSQEPAPAPAPRPRARERE
ncbi:MAG: HEAT repeat domain-containing protein [Betaproteobacteria bacterium]